MPDSYRFLDEVTRSYMVQAFNAAVSMGEVVAPTLMNPTGRERFTDLVREALEGGTEETLFQSLADLSFWTLYTYGMNLIRGFGMQPSEWLVEAERASRHEFRRWYEKGLALRQEAEGVDSTDATSDAKEDADSPGPTVTTHPMPQPFEAVEPPLKFEPFEAMQLQYYEHPTSGHRIILGVNQLTVFVPGKATSSTAPSRSGADALEGAAGRQLVLDVLVLPTGQWVELLDDERRKLPVKALRDGYDSVSDLLNGRGRLLVEWLPVSRIE